MSTNDTGMGFGEALISTFAYIVGGPAALFWTAGVLFACNVLFMWQEIGK